MESSMPDRLAQWEIHGFHTIEDLDVRSILKEAHSRWLRTNEIYAILCNYKYFNIKAKPLDMPTSGTLILFDRRALRNFRKDGHLWQKKKDGKTVKEAHEHLKVGNEERIHVYYAHGEANPKFVRRIYWLLDRAHEHIVLVHYREASEVSARCSISPQRDRKGASHLSNTSLISQLTPVNSSSSSQTSEKLVSWVSSEELDSGEDASFTTGLTKNSGFGVVRRDGVSQPRKRGNTRMYEPENAEIKNPEDLTIHAINTLDWEELLDPQDSGEGIHNVNTRNSQKKPYPSVQFNRSGMMNTIENRFTEDLRFEVGQQEEQRACLGNVGDQTSAPESVCQGKYLSNVMQSGRTSVEFGPLDEWKSEFKVQSQIGFTDQEKEVHNQWTESQSVQNPLFDTMDTASHLGHSHIQTSKSWEPNNTIKEDSFAKQDSFGRWLSSVLEDSPGSADGYQNGVYNAPEVQLDSYATIDESPVQGQVFYITEVSPMWAFSSAEETKVIITGHFIEAQKEFIEAKWLCVFGELIVPAEVVQIGVFRCRAPRHATGSVHLYLTCNGQVPYSQTLSFEYRASPSSHVNNADSFPGMDEAGCKEFVLQIRLAHLLFSGSKGISVLTNKTSNRAIDLEKKISSLVTTSDREWQSLSKLVAEKRKSFVEAKNDLLRLIFKKKLEKWLLEKVVEGSSATIRDKDGQGVVHLLAALDYEWAIFPLAAAGISVDFRDASGWTALHWAASSGRERMVAALLAAGANPSLVTDPTSEFPGGRTPADLASMKGHEGIAGYLAEKALTTHLSALTLYDKDDARKQVSPTVFEKLDGLTEDQLCMRDSLAAVRTAAEAASKIHTAFREHSFKMRMKQYEVDDCGILSEEAVKMIAALKIQKAYRNHQERRHFVAALQIQHRFRGWKIRREFLNLRRQVIKIQACFRGHQVRKQYCKILWSVGILEKAILRWRLKRKGLRGLQVDVEISSKTNQEMEGDNEDFFKISRKYAEERVERSAVRVQAMYRSYRARVDYRRMKQCFKQVQLEYEHILDNKKNTE